MRKIAYKIVLLVNIAHCANYADSNLPSTISLRANEQRQDFTISRKGNGEAYSFSANAVQIIGVSGATYELKADNAVTTFFSKGGFTLNNQALVALTGYHTLAIERGGISVGAESNLSYISSTQNISAGGTEYGGNPKVRFNTSTSLSLGINAKATFSDMSIFIHNGAVSLAKYANLKIEATKAIRFQESLTNDGGTITLNGNTYNIGGKRGNVPNDRTTIANFKSTNGNITINGDFYNGGQADNAVDTTGGASGLNVFDPAFGGGGNLVIYGGSMMINGKLVSTKGGDSVWGGEIINPQNSSVSIYGGTLSATGGVQNKVGSTLTIGAYNGTMGQIQGSVNNQGDFIIDTLGANAGNYTLITGNFSGNAPKLQNGNSDFMSATLSTDFKSLNIVKNDAKINDFKMSLDANESATLGAFDDGIYTISGASEAKLKATANAINHAIFSTFYATPLAMMDALGTDLSTTNATKTPSKRTIKHSARRVATNQTRQNRIRQTHQAIKTGKSATNSAYPNDVNAEFVLQGVAGNSANGVLSGVKVGYGVDFANAHFALKLAYAYGSVEGATKGDIATHKTLTKSHNFALRSNIEARFAGNFSFDFGVSGVTSLNNSTRAVESSAISLDSTLKSHQNIYQIALDLALLYNFKVKNFTITPYFGLNQGYIAMPNFAEKDAFSRGSAFALSAEAYSAYFLDAFAGAKMGFYFGDYGAILGDLEYKILAYKTQRTQILHYANGNVLQFVIPNAHKISADLGYRKDFNRWYLRINGNFGAMINVGKTSDTNTNFYTYGISAKFGWRF